MAKILLRGTVGIVLLGVLGVFIVRVYQQRDVLPEFYQWVISGKYIFEEIDLGRMHRDLTLKDLNFSIPPLDRIFNAGSSTGNLGLEKADIEKCRAYYRLVLEDMPQMQEAHVFLGFCEGKAENFPGAFLEFKQGLESGAGVFWASYDLGVLAMMQGNEGAAEVLFLRAAKLPLADVLRSILMSKLFQQYMQVNNMTPQKIWGGLNEARDDAIQNLKFIEEGRALTSDMSFRIF